MTHADFKDKRQLAWACRRGMLELDILFERYFNEQYDHASHAQQQAFQTLLTYQDQDLFNWLCKHEPCPHQEIQEIIKTLNGNRLN